MNGLSPLAQRMLAIAMSEQDRQSFDPSSLTRPTLPGGDSLSPLLRAQGGIADLEQQMGGGPSDASTLDELDRAESDYEGALGVGKNIDLDADPEAPDVTVPGPTTERGVPPSLPGTEPTIPRPPEGFVQPGPPQAGGKTPTPATTTGGPRAGKMRTRIMDGDRVVYDSLLDPLRNFSGGAPTDIGVGAGLRGLTAQARTPEERALAETSKQIAQDAWLNGLDAPSAMKLGLQHWQNGIGALEDSKRTDMMRPKGGGGGGDLGGFTTKGLGQFDDDLIQVARFAVDSQGVRKINDGLVTLGSAESQSMLNTGTGDEVAMRRVIQYFTGAAAAVNEVEGISKSAGAVADLQNRLNRWLAGGNKVEDFMSQIRATVGALMRDLRAAKERAGRTAAEEMRRRVQRRNLDEAEQQHWAGAAYRLVTGDEMAAPSGARASGGAKAAPSGAAELPDADKLGF